MRFAAFALLAFAAFDGPMPWLDRAGTAALGFAFLALTVGRVRGEPRPSISDAMRQLRAPPAPTIESVTQETDELLTAYLADDERSR